MQAVQWQPQIPPTAGAQPAGGFTLSVIVPVLNEERGLGQLIARLEPVLASTGADWEVIFVDDGSTDETSAQARRAA